MTLAALHLFLTMAGHSATMLSTSSYPFTQMGRWQEIVSDRMAICSTTSHTSGLHTKAGAPSLSARRNRIGVTDQGSGANFSCLKPRKLKVVPSDIVRQNSRPDCWRCGRSTRQFSRLELSLFDLFRQFDAADRDARRI